MATLLRFERRRAGAQKILDGGASTGRDWNMSPRALNDNQPNRGRSTGWIEQIRIALR
jgi:hypothetical protein